MSNLTNVPKIVYNAGGGDVTIQFEYPAQGLDFPAQNFRFVNKTNESTNGNYQTSDNYVEEERNYSFKQVNNTIKELVDTFMTTFAGNTRKTFEFFPDSSTATSFTMQLSRRQSSYRPKRTGWDSNGGLN